MWLFIGAVILIYNLIKEAIEDYQCKQHAIQKGLYLYGTSKGIKYLAPKEYCSPQAEYERRRAQWENRPKPDRITFNTETGQIEIGPDK